MRKLVLAAIGIAAVCQMVASGCGDRTLTVNVDILSFLDSTVVSQTYGDDPIIPPLPPGSPPIVIDSEPQQVNLSEGLSDITDIESVSLRVSSEFVNETGAADVRFQIFIADTLMSQDSLYKSVPYIDDQIHLEPATTDTVHVDMIGDETLKELFTAEAMQVGLRLRFDASGSSENVTGTANLIRFGATVVARRHVP